MMKIYYVTIKVDARYVAMVEADSVEEARRLGEEKFSTANLNECEVVEGEPIIVSDEDDIVWEA